MRPATYSSPPSAESWQIAWWDRLAARGLTEAALGIFAAGGAVCASAAAAPDDCALMLSPEMDSKATAKANETHGRKTRPH